MTTVPDQPSPGDAERRFRLMIESVKDYAIYTMDAAGTITSWNDGAERLFGYAAEEAIGQHRTLLFSPADISNRVPQREIEAAAATGQAAIEGWYARKDGSRFWVIGAMTSLRGPDGRLEGFSKVLRDRTREKQVQESLRESEERYRNLFNAIADPLFVYDRETLAYLAVNDVAVAEYGYSRDEFLRMTPKDIRPPEDIPRLLVTLERHGMGSENLGVWRHRKKNGQVIEVEITTYALDYAGRPARLVQARDVTARRQAEAEARRTGKLLQAVADGTPDAVFVKDREGKYLLFNHSAAQFAGRPAAEVIGHDDRAIFGPENAAQIMSNDRSVMESNSSQLLEETVSLGGQPRTFQALKSPHHDAQGNVIGLIGISRDITDRKQLEEQLRQSHKMEAIGRLAGGIAHDFNNLLTIITGYSELLLDNPELGDSVRAPVRAISEAGERAASLTRQLLGFSRQAMLQPEVLDLGAVIGGTVRMLERLIGEDIELTTVLANDLDHVKVDRSQLDQVLINLAINARDAMPTGGQLTIEAANVVLSGAYAATHLDCRPGPHVVLAMTDTGCGMPAEIIPHIFEPFFTTKVTGKGTGLGLAMVFGIVQQSGGCIHVYSEVGKGTTFKIYFPSVSEPAAEQAGRGEKDALRGSETILLVEDEAGVRGLAQKCLELHGYRVLSAADGPKALDMLSQRTEALDLLLTDVVMPQLSGPELAETLRQRFPHVKVLFMSGYTDDAVVRHGLLDAEVAFIQKPFSPTALAQRVRQVLDHG